MSIWILILLCVVQGLTEFLPVSSSGHLLLIEQIFGISGNLLLINLFLHMATLLAVVIVYRKVLWSIIKNPFQKYTLKLLTATLITVVFAVAYKMFNLNDYITKIYPFGFLVTSILLLACHLFQKRVAVVNSGDISIKNSAMVGAVQGLAVFAGLSRSGSTISSLILSGVDDKKASEFSFLLSIPIIVGGFVLECLQAESLVANSINFGGVMIYVFMFMLTFIVSLIALKLTIRLLKQQKFIVFSVYTFQMFIVTFTLNYII